MSDVKETGETPKPSRNDLDMAKIQAAMQGNDPEKTAPKDNQDTTEPSFVIIEDGKEVPLGPLSDPSKLKYELGSPHQDYQNYKDLMAGKRQHELGLQAATAGSLPDAIDTTLAARKEAQGADETPMDRYFYEKYGHAPYTTDAYPKLTEDEQPIED